MGLLQELENYRQPNGLYSNQEKPTNDSSGNCIAITALALFLAHRIGEFKNPENLKRIKEFEKEIHDCEVLGFPGLINRSPTKLGDQEGWDDYVALIAVTGKNSLNLSIAKDILEHGKNHFYSFNNIDPRKFTFKSFLGRYFQFIAHLNFANGINPFFIFKWLWNLGIALSINGNPTTIVLNYFMVKTNNSMSIISEAISEKWLQKNTDATMKNNIASWLSIDGKPNYKHPIVRYWA